MEVVTETKCKKILNEIHSSSFVVSNPKTITTQDIKCIIKFNEVHNKIQIKSNESSKSKKGNVKLSKSTWLGQCHDSVHFCQCPANSQVEQPMEVCTYTLQMYWLLALDTSMLGCATSLSSCRTHRTLDASLLFVIRHQGRDGGWQQDLAVISHLPPTTR